MKLEPKEARKILFPKVGTKWVCVNPYPLCHTEGIDLIEKDDRIIFLTAKCHGSAQHVQSLPPTAEEIRFWIIWVMKFFLPVQLHWYEQFPISGGGITSIKWEDYFRPAKKHET